jgi:hypothetical protein
MIAAGTIRYVARWMESQFWEETLQCGDPDKDIYRTKAFDSLEEAGKYGCELNCYGAECFVEVQELGINEQLFEDANIRRPAWNEVEEWLFSDGKKAERIYPE